MTTVNGLHAFELLTFLCLALVSIRRFFRHREQAALFIAAPFTILAVIVIAGEVLPKHGTDLVFLLEVKVLLTLISLFPPCLYLFLASFERPRAALRVFTGATTASVIGCTWAFTHLPRPGESPSLFLRIWSVLFVVQWIGISAGVAWRLWRAGSGLPTSPRRRARTLAGGITVMAVAVLIATATPASSTNPALVNVTTLVAILAAVLVLIGFAPPRFLVAIWHGPEDAALKEALADLITAPSAREVGEILLPGIQRLIGATGAVLRTLDGVTLAQAGVVRPVACGQPSPGEADLIAPNIEQLAAGHLRVLLPASRLDVWLSAYTPFFGRTEITQLRSLGSLLEVCLGNALARDRESLAAAALSEAQEIAQLGSWSWEEGSQQDTWSEQMSRLFGLEHHADGPSYEQALARIHIDDRTANAEQFAHAVATRSGYERDYRVVRPNGEIRWVHSRCKALVDPRTGLLTLSGTCQDITEDVELRERLSQMALTDALTSLPNRALLTDRLTHALAGLVRRPSQLVGVLFLDIDRFKVINDSMGHEAGDLVLLEVARRLQTAMRPGDTVARLGGDEFVVLCEGLDDEQEACAVAERLHESLRSPLHIGGSELVVTLSCGIATSLGDDASASSMLRDADVALYRAKNAGRARSAVFHESMRQQTLDRLETEIELRRALQHDEFQLYYQPQIDIASGRLVGVEALVRWQHPTRGLVGPDDFIAIAEETGLIIPIGSWILRAALAQIGIWQRTLTPDLRMSINLSAVQLAQPDLSNVVAQAIASSGVDPRSIELEITESVLMRDAADIQAALLSLHELGVQLSVDDFGTGYSSLAYLKRFPVDTLKVDRSFTSGLERNGDDLAIVSAIIAMAQAMGLTTVAEGVESELQLSELAALGCTRAQGFLFARPKSATGIEGDLRRLLMTAVTLPRPRPAQHERSTSL